MVDPKFGDDLVAKGDVSNYDFTIKRGGRVVATVSKKFFSARDVYGVEVVPGTSNFFDQFTMRRF
jgi:uncharacterized protein YxjI